MYKVFVIIIFLYIPKISIGQLNLIATDTIWKSDKYASFTSLVYINANFYCAFREAVAHRADMADDTTYGEIIIVTSDNGDEWKLFKSIKDSSADLRDPKLSVTPDCNLQLLYCSKSQSLNCNSHVKKHTNVITFYGNKYKKEQHDTIYINGYTEPFQWLWGITWHKGIAYGFMYGKDFLLLKSKNGVHYEIVANLRPFDDVATEASLIFHGDTAICVARGNENNGYYGKSVPPYHKWNWERMNIKLGGPALCMLPDNTLLLGTRNYQDEVGQTSLYIMYGAYAKKILTLPSDKDSSYPSFCFLDDLLYVTYYSGDGIIDHILISKLKYNKIDKF